MTLIEIGRNIALARNAAGLSQGKLGNQVGVSRQHIGNIEGGKVKKVDALLIDKIAAACGVTKFRLMGSKIAPKDWTAPEVHTKLEALLATKTEFARAAVLVIDAFYDSLRNKQRKPTD